MYFEYGFSKYYILGCIHVNIDLLIFKLPSVGLSYDKPLFISLFPH